MLYQDLKVGDKFRLRTGARRYTKISPQRINNRPFNATYCHRNQTMYVFLADGRMVKETK